MADSSLLFIAGRIFDAVSNAVCGIFYHIPGAFYDIVHSISGIIRRIFNSVSCILHRKMCIRDSLEPVSFCGYPVGKS